MSKHTPGPWRIGGLNRQIMEDRKGRGQLLGFDCVLATMPPWDRDDDAELEANARLIASAPELLQTLKLVSEHLQNNQQGHVLRDEIEKLIAKAEGGK